MNDYLHLPTLIALAIISWLLVWHLFEADFSWGQEYIRLSTKQGQMGLYWHHGCCDIEW
jgi:hypothetical protein